jgi:signal transduction histidine kinase
MNSVNKKVLIAVCVVFVIPYILSSFYVTSFIQNKVEEDYINLSNEQMERVYTALYYNVIEQASQAIDVFSVRKETKNLVMHIGNKIYDPKELDPDLYSYLQIYKDARKNYITAIAIGTNLGGYFECIGDRKEDDDYDPRVRPWYIPAINQPNQIIISDPYVKTNGQFAIAVSKAITGDNNEPIGVIAIGWDLENFQKEIESVKIGISGYIIILDKNNNIITNQKGTDIGRQQLDELDMNSEAIQKIAVNDKIKYIRVKTIQNEWKIISIIDNNEIDSQVSIITKSIKITYTMTLIIMATIFTIIYLRFSIGIKKLLDAACSIIKGNEEVHLDIDRNDEIGTIARALNKMILEVEKRNKELFRLNGLNLVGQMAAGIAHEIRNPMTTVKGYLQYISAKEPKYKERFDIMLDELDRANSIITEFLSLAKNKLVDLKPHNLNDIILNISPLLKSDALMQNKIILSHLNSIPKLKVDEKEIRQMILNLVRNGLEAMEEKKTLTIETFFKVDEVILAIKDEGSGIPTEILDTIGMPFVTTKDTGTGLGLATCYSIASRNNATIKINTSENGTTFFIKFKC